MTKALSRDEQGKIDIAIDCAIGSLQDRLAEYFPELEDTKLEPPYEVIELIRVAMRVYAMGWLDAASADE